MYLDFRLYGDLLELTTKFLSALFCFYIDKFFTNYDLVITTARRIIIFSMLLILINETGIYILSFFMSNIESDITFHLKNMFLSISWAPKFAAIFVLIWTFFDYRTKSAAGLTAIDE